MPQLDLHVNYLTREKQFLARFLSVIASVADCPQVGAVYHFGHAPDRRRLVFAPGGHSALRLPSMALVTPDQSAQSEIEATYKAREVEGLLDLYFYRKVGFQLARFFAKLGLTPDSVTLLGTAIGIVAGHFYFYRNLGLNVVGMCLHVFANALDNADGQLARLTNRQSPAGRVIDGIGDNLVFASVYLHLCLRFTAGGGSAGVWILALLAGLSHSVQSATAEFCRDAYLYFSAGKLRSLDSSLELRRQYEQLSWRSEFFKKLLVKLHFNYAFEQELFSPALISLEQTTRAVFAGGIPSWFQDEYRESGKGMIQFFNLLRTNSRMILLFLLLFVGRPVWYFAIELFALNLLLAFIVVRQNALCHRMETLVTNRAAD